MYSLTPGYRIPALQRGLSPVETLLTKANAGVGGAVLMSAVITPPPAWTFGAVGAAAMLLNVAPGPRSIARWVTVGYRHWRERTVPASVVAQSGATTTWALYPEHGTMQDPQRRAAFHAAFSRALAFAGGQARSAGIQVHVTHHTTVRDHTAHTQTISVHVPKGLVGHPCRVIGTLEGEFAALGVLTPITPEPIPAVTGRGPGWAALDDGRYAATARVTAWPEETGSDLMPKLLLGQDADRSFAVLYRPLPPGQSRRSAKWQRAAAEAFTADKVKQDANEIASGTTHGALVQGATLVDLDAYLTVWGDSPETVIDARWQASLDADRHRIHLDWLAGQQHRAHVMNTPHGATTRKGALL
ncbi:hypothetical protein AQI88_24175 [Streptomyces cellostaticus]|uniref:Uncharacterized protein n=1 Tax=Streptomyces cellostaticus TaxID=67285 RepID=A0A101NIE0_9ACTN|nr:hypothetical protein [Streptomyces cellostaticus]KUM93851.1 hypothetical protein AQI88_24175 [Streptomyces cellostaticus]GHI04979.1 hypothetical protein Scel_33000 [Streptomyces cellostaticus]